MRRFKLNYFTVIEGKTMATPYLTTDMRETFQSLAESQRWPVVKKIRINKLTNGKMHLHCRYPSCFHAVEAFTCIGINENEVLTMLFDEAVKRKFDVFNYNIPIVRSIADQWSTDRIMNGF